MLANHVKNCDCLDCVKENHYTSYQEKYRMMYGYLPEDHAEGTADQFIDGTLKALVPVTVYSAPGGVVLKTIKKGDIVGKIFSFKKLSDGSVWWQLYPEVTMTVNSPNAAKGNFVKHGTGIFDPIFLENSIKAEKAKTEAIVKEATEKRIAENTNTLYVTGKNITKGVEELTEGITFLSGNLKWIIGAAVVLILVGLFMRAKG